MNELTDYYVIKPLDGYELTVSPDELIEELDHLSDLGVVITRIEHVVGLDVTGMYT